MKRELNWNLSGNEVHYTNSSILLVKNMLCSKFYCQKDFNSIPYKIFRNFSPKPECTFVHT
jgi:hypothetical protein